MIQTTQAVLDALYSVNVQRVRDLYTFAFASGTAYWTPAKTVISWGGHDYQPFVLSRGKLRRSASLEIDKLQITLYPGSATLNGVPMRLAALQGKFHGVKVTLQRAVFNVDGSVAGAIIVFDGTVDDVYTGSTSIGLSVKSVLASLAGVQLPKRLVEPECGHTFCDSGCTLSLATYTSTLTVVSAVSLEVRVSTTQAANFYQLGTVAFGGETRMIRESEPAVGSPSVHVLHITAPFSTLPSGSVVVTRGCAKTREACTGFSNLANFSGFPDMPPPESVY